MLKRIYRSFKPVQNSFYLNFSVKLIPVNGEPLIGQEPKLFARLQVVDDHVGQVPGLHLSKLIDR